MIYKKIISLIKLLIFLNISFSSNALLFAQEEDSNVYLTMDEAIQRALAKNNLLRASQFALKKANWDKVHAYTLLLPAATFNTRYTWIDDSSFALRDFSRYFRDGDPNMPFKIDIPQTVFQESYASSFDVSMPLFNAGLLNNLSIARAGQEMSDKLFQSTRNQVIFQAVSAYLTVAYANEILKLQQEYMELSRLNYEKAERLQQAGRYSKTEALRWKVDYQQQKSLVSASESALRSARALLNRTVNLEMLTVVMIAEAIPPSLRLEMQRFQSMEKEEILKLIDLNDAKLLEANAALAAAKSNERLSKLGYRGSYDNYLPNVSLAYQYAWRENNTLALDDYSPQTFMINFSFPLFNSFQDFTTSKSSYYAYKSSQEQFQDQLQNTRLMLTETVNKILNLRTQIELSKTSVEFSENNYRVVEQQKEAGLVSNIEFIDAKLNLQNARLSDVKNQYDFIAAIVELDYLLNKLDFVVN